METRRGEALTNSSSTKLPSVSVVINNYNYGRFLGEAVDSALGQTYPYLEVVVVDDGSTDDSREVIASYGDQVITVLKDNGGQGSAFNAGFSASSGEVVIFLDSDDYLFPRAVERVVTVWEPGVAKVQYRLQRVDALGNPTGDFDPPLNMPLSSGEVWRLLLQRGAYVRPPTSGYAFSRVVLELVFPMPEAEWRHGADGYLVNSVPFYGRVSSIEKALGAYRVHGSNSFAYEGVPNGEWFVKLLQRYSKHQKVIADQANKLGYSVPTDLLLEGYGGLASRLSSLRLDPQKHPIPSDRRLGLVYRGLIATWRHSEFDRGKRLIHSALFIWVGLLPVPLARRALAWLYAPHSRPKALELIRGMIRDL